MGMVLRVRGEVSQIDDFLLFLIVMLTFMADPV